MNLFHKTIAQHWHDVKKQCIPKKAGKVQLIESERIFYCGAASMFWMLMNNLSESEEETGRLFDSLEAELTNYFNHEIQQQYKEYTEQ